jgi:tetratricopeptide (TPR) repeat protein
MTAIVSKSLTGVILFVLMLLCMGCSSPEEKKQAFMRKGDQLYAQKEYVTARLEYKNAIQIDPEFALAYYHLGKTELALDNVKRAYGMINKAVELDPENIEARIDLGKIFLSGKASDRAMEQADAVLAKDPSNVDAFLLKAAAFFVDKKYDPGEKILMDLYRAGVTSPDIYMMLFSLSQTRGDKDAVRAYLMEGVQKNPDHTGLIQYLAQLDANEQQFDAAAAGLEKVIALEPEEIRHKLNLARLLNRQGKFNQAEALLDKVLSENPEDEQTRLDIAGFWVTENQVEKAENIMRQGLEQTPKSFVYHRFLADILAKTGQLDAAEKTLNQALALSSDPGHPEIIQTQVDLVRLLARQERYEEAEALVDQVITHDPKNIRAHFLKAKFYLSRNDGVNAIPGFRMMVEEHPEEVEAHMNLARAHILNEEYELAANVLEKAIEKLPEEEKLLVALVRLNVMRDDRDAVEATLKRALRVHPKNSRVGIALGDFYMSEGRYNEALAQYLSVVGKQPDEAAGYVKAAFAYQYLKQPEEALARLEEGYRRIPDSGLLLTRLAKWYMDADSPETAKKLSLDHLEKNPASQEAWMVLADLYVKEKDLEKAAGIYAQAFEKHPDMWSAANNYAYLKTEIAKDEQDVADAMEMARKAEQLNPDSAVVADTLGWIYFKMGDLDRAYDYVKTALEKLPDHDSINFHMGMILESQGKGSEAKSYFEKSGRKP